MTDISKIISGFRVYKATTFPQQKDLIEHLIRQGQKPSTLFISCIDIRRTPAEIFAAIPGEFCVINTLGALVPQYKTSGVHGILSAIEYAVTGLEVENIIILGHANCHSIKMMMSEQYAAADGLSESMKTWLSLAEEARTAIKKELADKTIEEQEAACGTESIIISLRNLMGYPYVVKRMEEDKLNIYGWHFNAGQGSIMAFDPDTGFFEPIS